MSAEEQPVNNVEWVSRDTLNPNDYNPNRVAPPELELLAVSILEDGWTQPIVVHHDGTIVDGYHRYLVSGREDVSALTGGLVPVVRLEQDPIHARMSTIRHNRARGTHGVISMAGLVRGMLEENVSVGDICARLGMEDEEVYRLADRAGMPVKEARKRETFGNSWVPGE